MSDKSLKKKAIKIKGNSYVQVSDRVIYFNDTYPKGAIQTKLLTDYNSEDVYMVAKVIPDVDKPERYFTGYSQERWGVGMVNKTSALENAETSAVGRALAMMGIGVIDSIASTDEINKAVNRSEPSWMDSPAAKKLDDQLVCKKHNKRFYKSKFNDSYYHKNDDGTVCTMSISQIREQ